LVGRGGPEGKGPLESRVNKRIILKKNLKEMEWKGVDWIYYGS